MDIKLLYNYMLLYYGLPIPVKVKTYQVMVLGQAMQAAFSPLSSAATIKVSTHPYVLHIHGLVKFSSLSQKHITYVSDSLSAHMTSSQLPNTICACAVSAAQNLVFSVDEAYFTLDLKA